MALELVIVKVVFAEALGKSKVVEPLVKGMLASAIDKSPLTVKTVPASKVRVPEV